MIDVQRLADLVSERRVMVLTGAGCSTESGIPDYRGPDSKGRSPMQYRDFVQDLAARRQYWARSAVGWQRVFGAKPNAAHVSLAQLERSGVVTGVITQNVDGLHHRAGSQRVLELHGSLARVGCLECGELESRAGLQQRLEDLNPAYGSGTAEMAPDGDAEVGRDLNDFVVPGCRCCGGVLKPDVVFFGENVPKDRVQRAWDMYDTADMLLVVGSSLAVYSGYRFVLRAAKERRDIAIVNVGATRGDKHATVKVEGKVGSILPLLVRELLVRRRA